MAHFMHAEGLDLEIVEVWTGIPYQRYEHVHLLTKRGPESDPIHSRRSGRVQVLPNGIA
jgi:hypothetical protein